MISLHVAKGADWATYRTIRLRALADSPDSFGATLADTQARSEDQFRAQLDGPALTLIALEEDEPVGMGGVFPQPEAGNAFIWGMWTAPESRRRGIADLILVRCLDWCAERELHPHLHVTIGNDAARATYLKRGFRPTGVVEPLRPGSDKQIEELRLSR